MSEEELLSATSASSVEDTPSELGSKPTHEERMESTEITTQWLDDFHLGSNMPGGSAVGGPTSRKWWNQSEPAMEFTGRRDQIESSRFQRKLYWKMNPEKSRTMTEQGCSSQCHTSEAGHWSVFSHTWELVSTVRLRTRSPEAHVPSWAL